MSFGGFEGIGLAGERHNQNQSQMFSGLHTTSKLGASKLYKHHLDFAKSMKGTAFGLNS